MPEDSRVRADSPAGIIASRPLRGRRWSLLPALLLVLATGCAAPGTATVDPEDPALAPVEASRAALAELVDRCSRQACSVALERGTAVDTIEVDVAARHVDVRFNAALGHIPFRPSTVDDLNRLVGEQIAPFFPGHSLTIWGRDRRIDELIPNYYRTDPEDQDPQRVSRPHQRPAPLVRNLDRAWQPAAGLEGRYIALWPSHGWYYNQQQDRWMWQRARLFQTIEDLLPMAFTQPYLVPMLERAGATVFIPRERDLQVHEVIVDNDRPGSGYAELAEGWRPGARPGFGVGEPPYGDGVNPFRLGTYRVATSAEAPSTSVRWTPDFPEAGEYAVHVSYAAKPDGVTDARYSVHHAGGSTRFEVNQRIGGGTWIYLGTFRFGAGSDADRGSVVLTNQSATAGKTVTADGVRFGGGMGNVERGGRTSARPRWVEAARYYMQYTGMPDSLVYSLSAGADDYTDDFRGRGEWVGYLRGSPFGPNRDRHAGLGIPVDLSLSFHTDAGVSRSDTTVGTLMIYSTEDADSTFFFPDGVSRIANRDLGDLLQTQIVEDVRVLYDPAWRRRGLWDRRYAEAVRPNVPSGLLELISHQNFLDMKFALDPRFRFDASRSIYKGILRFLATHHGQEYVVQPLPVSHFEALLTGSDSVTLRWQPTVDPLEPTAMPAAYVVYTRVGEGGFDNGTLVEGTAATFSGLEPGVIYSYRVTAVNAGGEGFPSETLSVASVPGGRGAALVVNGFERVAGPEWIEEGDLAGFQGLGVPDRYDLHHVGAQFNFDRGDEWVHDDAPGHGASYGDLETLVIPGNTFDFPYLHGQSLLAAGYGFASASAAAVGEGAVDLAPFDVVDLILGAQKKTPWPKPGREPQFEALPVDLRRVLAAFCEDGGGLFVSGAYVGTDLFAGAANDASGPEFARNTLGITWRTDRAARTGGVFSTTRSLLPEGLILEFNSGYHPELYTVESPDVIEPAGESGQTILRYAENTMSAAVASRGACPAVVLGFPFETILTPESRDLVMEAVIRYLEDAEGATGN